jgi:Holliday junction DNA helicase RuvA
MLSYIVGKVVSLNKRSITLENNYMGFVIYVTHPEKFEISKVKKFYVYKHISTNIKNNMVEYLYGFNDYEQKELFLHLININGIGPKTALSICKNDVKTIANLIAQRDVQSLSILEGITPKYARIMVDNLCEMYNEQRVDNDTSFGELIKALKTLGYHQTDIEFAIKKLNMDLASNELSDLISQAIKLIATHEDSNNGTKTN